jgi:hypothetical protein
MLKFIFCIYRYCVQHKSDNKHYKHIAVIGQQIPGNIRPEIVQYLVDHFPTVVERIAAEKYPAKANEMESKNYANHFGQDSGNLERQLNRLNSGHPQFIQRQGNTVQSTPENVVPIGTVPQTSQKHGDEKVFVRVECAAPAAAEGYVQIIP